MLSLFISSSVLTTITGPSSTMTLTTMIFSVPQSDIVASKPTVSTSSDSSISGGSHARTSSSLTATSTKSAMDSPTPKDALSKGAIVGTAIGLLFVLAASVGIFILVYRRRHQAVMANLGRVSPLLTDDWVHIESGGANPTPMA
ncbi:hypothetical protein BDP27DRAFT_575471 [Rhodocollybia butyracea]|uniref:Uncharacterized protein n=1 Tax=Rhodocollybia butyracea TaxID=206335 RepID=A0A9P5PAC0_9AGAR|nr:hypothetical protein BDP27DRAFT_575471 [Rhodocollybia butyracea]